MAGEEYDIVGTNLRRQASAQQEAAARKLNQQFSGRLNSGAAAKLQEQSSASINQGLEANLGQLEFQKAQDARQERLQKEQQAYGTSERLGSQEFAGQQAELGRQYGTQERLGGQEFTAGQSQQAQQYAAAEAAKQREYGTGERLGTQAFQQQQTQGAQQFAQGERVGTQNFQAGQAALDRTLQQANIDLGFSQLNEQAKQFSTEFIENQKTNFFNKVIALKDVRQDDFLDAAQFLGLNSKQNLSDVLAQTVQSELTPQWPNPMPTNYKPAASSSTGTVRIF